MYSEKAANHNFLKDAVNAVWLSEMKENESAYILPDGTSDIIIKSNSAGADIFICGVMTEPAAIVAEEDRKYWGFRFNPGYASLFLNFGDIKNQLLNINSLFTEKSQIEDLMNDPVANSDKIEILITQQILQSIDEVDFKRKSRLIEKYSKVEFGHVDSFSKELGISRRQFSRNFKGYFGYDPRYFSKLKKFNKFIEATQSDRSQALSELALDCNFYDQSDLSHTIKEVCGLSPKALMSQLYNT